MALSTKADMILATEIDRNEHVIIFRVSREFEEGLREWSVPVQFRFATDEAGWSEMVMREVDR